MSPFNMKEHPTEASGDSVTTFYYNFWILSSCTVVLREGHQFQRF